MKPSSRRILLLPCAVCFLFTTPIAPNFAGVEVFQSQAQVQPRRQTAQDIKLVTARGRLGRKRREPTEKPVFVAVDLSKYQSGRLFIDLKASSGGCNVALLAAVAPTEERKGLLELSRVLSGGTKTKESLSFSHGRLSLQGQKVNKFYVAGFLIPVGIMAWYSKDCTGSYEATIYIQNAVSSGGGSTTQLPCRDNDIHLTYNRRALDYHSYREQTPVCSINTPNCTVDRVFSTMLTSVQYVVPYTTSRLRVTNCMTFDVDIPGPFNVDKVRIVVDRNNSSVTNYTKRGHIFHPGKVTRTIVQRGNGIYVETFGEGNGKLATPNELGGPSSWRSVDAKLVNAVNSRL